MSKLIKTLKLTTGETLIAEVVLQTDNKEIISVKNPTLILINEMTGQAALKPWTLGYYPGTININPLSVIYIIDAPEDIIESYNELWQKITTGLVTASTEDKKLLLG